MSSPHAEDPTVSRTSLIVIRHTGSHSIKSLRSVSIPYAHTAYTGFTRDLPTVYVNSVMTSLNFRIASDTTGSPALPLGWKRSAPLSGLSVPGSTEISVSLTVNVVGDDCSNGNPPIHPMLNT